MHNNNNTSPAQPTDETVLLHRRIAVLEALVAQYASAQEVLRQCELQYQQIVESVNSIILRMDTNGTVLFLNQFGRRFFGYEEQEIVGRSVIGTIVPPTDTAGRDLAAMIRDIGEHPERYITNENENICRNGERVWIAWTNKAVYNSDGTVREILCVGNDLTQHRKAEQELERQRRLLAERVKELNCLYSISKVFQRQDPSCEDQIKEIVELIPPAFEFADKAAARITLYDRSYESAHFSLTPWCLRSPIFVGEQEVGSIEVCYREACPQRDEGPFQKEERELVTTVAEMLGRFITRKQMQDALVAHEIKYKTLFENLPQKISYKDSSLAYVSCNINFARDFNLQPEDIVGKTDYDLFPREQADRYRAEDLQVLKQGVTIDVEETQTLDGRETVLHKIKAPVTGPDGNPSGIITIIIDITEQRRLQREKASFEAVIENNLTEISIKNEITEILLSTRNLTDILHMILIGATAYQALGFNRAFLFLLDDHEQMLKGTVATGALTPDEAYRTWARLAQERHTLTELLASARSSRDAGDAPINHLVRSLHIPLTDSQSVFTRAVRNRRSFNIIGGSHLAPSDREWVTRLGTDSFALVPLVCRGKCLGVLLADNFINRKPITDADVAGLTAFANHASLAIENSRLYESLKKNLDELSRANQELRESRDKLIQYERLSIVGEMAAKIAHDIRNPMTAIGGFAKRMLTKEPDPEQSRTYLEIIVKEIDRLEKILNDILSFTKPSPPLPLPVDLNRVVHSAVELMAQELEKNHIVYREHYEPSLPIIRLDENQMKRVFINLIKNAIEAMPDGGEMDITTRYGEERALITIADTGPGISDGLREKIFEPFFTSKATGSGLGLTLARQIVTAHNGTISVERAQPCGTVVTISLPCACRDI